MSKHAKNSNHRQAVDLPKTMAVEIPLPLLEAFGSIESSFFELCIDSGQQVLKAMMEQDREDLCGPRWKRDPERRAGRAGTTKSEVTLCGRRISIPRPRVRSNEGAEMELPSFAFAANRDYANLLILRILNFSNLRDTHREVLAQIDRVLTLIDGSM